MAITKSAVPPSVALTTTITVPQRVPNKKPLAMLSAVAPGNENAVALYRRKGFTFTGELGDLMPDGVRREHIMAKNLRCG